jgi:hypothetical protein
LDEARPFAGLRWHLCERENVGSSREDLCKQKINGCRASRCPEKHAEGGEPFESQSNASHDECYGFESTDFATETTR